MTEADDPSRRPRVDSLSELERSVLESMIRGDAEEEVLRAQLEGAGVAGRDHTGVGIFVDLTVSPESPRTRMSNRYLEDTPKSFLGHPGLKDGGEATL